MEIISAEEGALRLAEIKQVIKEQASNQRIDTMMNPDGSYPPGLNQVME